MQRGIQQQMESACINADGTAALQGLVPLILFFFFQALQDKSSIPNLPKLQRVLCENAIRQNDCTKHGGTNEILLGRKLDFAGKLWGVAGSKLDKITDDDDMLLKNWIHKCYILRVGVGWILFCSNYFSCMYSHLMQLSINLEDGKIRKPPLLSQKVQTTFPSAEYMTHFNIVSLAHRIYSLNKIK